MWIETKELEAMCFAAENRLLDIDAQNAALYHMALMTLIEVFKDANELMRDDESNE